MERHGGLTVQLITNADPAIFQSIAKRPNLAIVKLAPHGWVPYKVWSIYAHCKASIVARLRGIRCLVSITPHGSFIPFVDQLIIVHDTYDLDRDFKSPFHVVYSRIIRKLSIYAAKAVVCVSDTTSNEVRRLLRVPAPKLSVIKEASKYSPTALDPPRAEDRPASRFLFVANVEKTKNAVCLLEALRLAQNRRLPIEVNWIGRDPSGIVEDWTRNNPRLANFFPLGYATDEALRKAYMECAALIVPSLKEGFCLPVIEAHSFGTPVIGSDIPILREVVGAGGIFFNPSDPEDLLNALNTFSSDAALRSSLQQKAAANARLYSWGRSAEQLERLAMARCRLESV